MPTSLTPLEHLKKEEERYSQNQIITLHSIALLC